MTTLYTVEMIELGTYVLGCSVQAEEPEFFSHNEAVQVAGAIDRDYGRNVTRVHAVDFSDSEIYE